VICVFIGLYQPDLLTSHHARRGFNLELTYTRPRLGANLILVCRMRLELMLAAAPIRWADPATFQEGSWWAHQDLNLGPTDYESAALTN
jgi:hypothetical protein